ncbi:hypothetical protein PUN28_012232 [Cardiocondyla obscurior]|uniref:Uncharacterized protein n=1 Tax=Cardiocondyla obscurior TaxID=286306 RepID=A0AAW2FCN0_9HYME
MSDVSLKIFEHYSNAFSKVSWCNKQHLNKTNVKVFTYFPLAYLYFYRYNFF